MLRHRIPAAHARRARHQLEHAVLRQMVIHSLLRALLTCALLAAVSVGRGAGGTDHFGETNPIAGVRGCYKSVLRVARRMIPIEELGRLLKVVI